MVLTFNDKEEKTVKQIIAALADSIQFEVMQPRCPRSFFSGTRNKTAPTPGTPGRN